MTSTENIWELLDTTMAKQTVPPTVYRGQAPLKDVNLLLKEYWNASITPEVLEEINERLFPMGYHVAPGVSKALDLFNLPLKRERKEFEHQVNDRKGNPMHKTPGAEAPQPKKVATVLRLHGSNGASPIYDKDLKRKLPYDRYLLVTQQLESMLAVRPEWTVHDPHVRKYNEKLNGFLDKFEDGDELWEYDNISMLSGSSGLVILRNNKVVDMYMIRIA